MHPAWLRCESLKYRDNRIEDPVVHSGRFRALPGRRLNTLKCKFIDARTLKEEIMAILSRMMRLFKADVHGVMDQLEDKGLLLKQYLREMEASLEDKQGRLDRIEQSIRQAENDLKQRTSESKKLENDLDLAVRKEKDDIARMLIRKRRSLQGSCAQLKHQIEALAQDNIQISETVARQRLQYDQLTLKVAAFGQQVRPQGLDQVIGADGPSQLWRAPTEQEIELELLQRKEALQQGGAT
jgi:phage shock protein A